MILRKPYAFLIKNFRFIHIIFAILSGYLLYKSNNLLNFFSDYINSNGLLIENFTIKGLLSGYVYLWLFVIIIINVVVVWLMYFKRKSVFFYIINLIIYFLILILMFYASSILSQMEVKLLDTRVVRAVRDFFVFANVAQLLGTIMYAFRATGFDVKKFNFGQDLVELDVAEADNEEFEFEVDLDIDKLNRERRRKLRMLKYFYIENKFVVHVSIIGVILLVIYISIFGIGNKATKYNPFEVFGTDNYMLEIGNSYISSQDKNDKTIDEKYSYVILEVFVKQKSSRTKRLNTGRFELYVGNDKYYHNITTRDYFNDIGKVYYNEDLTSKYERYLLTYKVSNKDINKNKYLRYIDENNNIVINFKPQNINKYTLVGTYELNNNIKFSNSILNNYDVKINSYDLQNKFTINYSYCLTTSNCVNAKEFLTPSISTNYDKALLKITGTLTLPERINESAYNVESLISNFGVLKYTIGDKTYQTKLNLGFVKPLKTKQNDTYYVQVKKEVMNATSISLVFKLRNKEYEYKLK